MSNNTTSPGPGVELVSWKPIRKNTLVGFATIRLRMGLEIADVSVHASGEKRWASTPSKPVLDRDGQQQRDQAGKLRYVPILTWASRDIADRFSAAVLAAVEAAHPGVFSG